MTTRSQETRIALVGGRPLRQHALAALLERGGFSVLETWNERTSFHRLVASWRPGAVVFDTEGSCTDESLNWVVGFKARFGGTSLVIIVSDMHRVLSRHLLEAGADALLDMDDPPEALATAVRSALRSETWISPKLSLGILKGQLQDYPEPLTVREMQVLELMCQGYRNAEIADVLGISLFTVKNHVSKILAKLGAGSRLEAVLVAMQLGMLDEGSGAPISLR